jgi:hypothetical protein
MKVKYLKTMAGPSGSVRVGDTADVDEDTAKRLAAKGIAEPVKSSGRGKTTSKKAESAEQAIPDDAE